MRIGEQIAEAVAIHQKMKRKEAWQQALEMLKKVGIPEPEMNKSYRTNSPGGMRQRVMIAIALSCNPKVMIADEPTTALDVTIQLEILNLILKLQQDYHTATVLITHDLGVVAETCQNVLVMHAGNLSNMRT